MNSEHTAKKNDFVEIKYTGYANGEVFDSNEEENLKKVDPNAKVKKTVVIIGQGMVVPGLDKALEGKEVGKEHEIEISPKEGFGVRKKELVKTMPLNVFTEKRIRPVVGMVLNMDNMLAKIVAVSGGRVTTDFNHPLSGKDLKYNFKITRVVTDEKERAEVMFEQTLRFVPEFEIKDKEIVLKGPKPLEAFAQAFSDKFKELVGKPLGFEEKSREEVKKIGKEEPEEESQ